MNSAATPWATPRTTLTPHPIANPFAKTLQARETRKDLTLARTQPIGRKLRSNCLRSSPPQLSPTDVAWHTPENRAQHKYNEESSTAADDESRSWRGQIEQQPSQQIGERAT